MDNTILQYEISSWEQLKDCRSNTSPDLRIRVCEYLQNPDIEGTKVSVEHPVYGTLLAYTITPKGNLTRPLPSDVTNIMRSQTLLNELARYGFYVSYVEEAHLSAGQVELLRTIRGLHFDKLRLVAVHANNDASQFETYVAAFNIKYNQYWLNPGYSPSRSEWENAIISGNAMNVSGLEYAAHYDWSWVYNAVFDIDKLLQRYDTDE